MDKKYRYWVEVTWMGRTKRLFGSDKRKELDEWAMGCGPEVEVQVIDILEEEVNEHGGHHRPRRGA